jgi:hypothetical protein
MMEKVFLTFDLFFTVIIGLTCGFFSYNGEISATIVANQDVLTNTEEDEMILNSFFQKEINLLIRELS